MKKFEELKSRIQETCEHYSLSIYPLLIDYLNQFEKCNTEFEQSNEPEKLPKDTREYIAIWKEMEEQNSHFQVIADNHQLEINSMKAEIESLKKMQDCHIKEIVELQANNNRGASLIDADKVFDKDISVYEKEQPKQERFTLEDYSKDAVDMKILKDGLMFDYSYRKNAEFVCNALNKLEQEGK